MQEPLIPYPYDGEEVGFVNQADRVGLVSTLTLLRGPGTFSYCDPFAWFRSFRLGFRQFDSGRPQHNITSAL